MFLMIRLSSCSTHLQLRGQALPGSRLVRQVLPHSAVPNEKNVFVSDLRHQICYVLLSVCAPAWSEVHVVYALWPKEQKGL